ncbi:hypothetical protein PISL3812_00991 [Talaromyces islandicus]|uniref:Uncharacterized protein n=1 Tax=Talaromyces islandicus TaxID=28573 RepID=A0A0U1LKT4_TALIS|nr:hypothetical protein PISL3812_00991 [Talaromyces islandicus]
MLTSVATLALCWLSSFQSVTGAAVGELNQNVRRGDPEVVDAVGRALREAGQHGKDTVYRMNKTSIAKSWKDATLFSIGSELLDVDISVTCATCYIKGTVNGHLKIRDDLNVTEVVDSVASQVKNATHEAWEEVKDYVEDAAKDIASFDISDIPAFPTLDVDFNLDKTAGLPPIEARFEFDDLEFYLDFDLNLAGGTYYMLKLFTSETPAGFSIPGLEAGALFKATLYLTTESDVDITSGIHLKVEDGLALDMELFSKKVSGMKVPGAHFELLPVKIHGHGSIEAILQLEAVVGFNLETPSIAGLLEASTGVEASIFANVADFYVEVKGGSERHCELAAHAEYTLAVGGAAGATLAVGNYLWGPEPVTSTDIWYTTLPRFCAHTKTKTKHHTVTKTKTKTTHVTGAAAHEVTARAAVEDHASKVTTTVSTTEKYTIVNCLKKEIGNCPNNMQNTTSVKRTLTTVLTVPSGVDASYPPNTHASVTSVIPFGTNRHTVAPTTGVPTPHAPKKTSA